MTTRTGSVSQRRWAWILCTFVLIALVVGLVLFKPWLLFIEVEVNDTLPLTTSERERSDSPQEAESNAAPESPRDAPQPATVLSRGESTSHEHVTSGLAQIVELPDGSRQLLLENLRTSNGPDVHVWLSSGPVVPGTDGWFTAGQYDFIDLGLIKGNIGNQLYDIPDDVNLDAFLTVDSWCAQFSVSFGAASLSPQ
ncbi:DM13 domain-containing protein [Leucobacter sp. Z1108]|uniref:DM13 domain-containing protein n=1 Tax=Leucobacter sp. Z1108 TaxID=3439066 RepID=UPI003F31DFF6